MPTNKKSSKPQYKELGASSDQPSKQFTKKPVASAFYKAHPDAWDTLFIVEVIFPPTEPYNAWGLITSRFRCNIDANSEYGKAVGAGIKVAIADGCFLNIQYDPHRIAKFKVLRNEEEGTAQYEERSSGFFLLNP